MAEVLSQSQIDALLSAAFSGEKDLSSQKGESPEKKYRKYDFYSPRKFTKDRIKMLHGIFDNYSHVLNTRINGLVHSTCEVEVESVEEQRYYEFSNALTEGSVLAVAHLVMNNKREEVPVLLYATPTVMVSMMDRMTGGDGTVEDDLPADYVYTDLDLCLYENLMRDFVSVIGTSWESYIELDFEFGRVEENPTLVQLIGLEETVVLVDMNLRFPNCEGRINICLPGMMLTNIFTQINLINPAQRMRDEDNSEEIYTHLRDSSLMVIAELGHTSLLLSDIYNLNVGDVIDLNQKKDSPVRLRIGGRQWFGGIMGIHDKHMAVKIKEVYHTGASGPGSISGLMGAASNTETNENAVRRGEQEDDEQ